MANQFQDNSYDGISVIIPVYNASKYLHRTIDSVLNRPEVDWIYKKLDIERELSKKYDVSKGSKFLLNYSLYHLFITFILLKAYAKDTRREYDYRKSVMEKILAFPIFDKCERCAHPSSRIFYFLMKKDSLGCVIHYCFCIVDLLEKRCNYGKVNIL